jgi:hypothetical protein
VGLSITASRWVIHRGCAHQGRFPTLRFVPFSGIPLGMTGEPAPSSTFRRPRMPPVSKGSEGHFFRLLHAFPADSK